MSIVLLYGLLGGVLRGLVGYVKYSTSYKNVHFRSGYFISSISLAGLIGFLAAWVTRDLKISFLGLTELTSSIAFIIGYAGGDFIENLFKIITGKASLYKLPK